MKAPNIRYECPETLEQALACMARDDLDYQPLAGGQSLVPMMNLRLAQPEVLLDLNQLRELSFIESTGSHVNIGAMVRYSELSGSELIQSQLPLFQLALPSIAHQAVRNRGTIGGSTALADPAAEMPALLKALDAGICAISQAGKRVITADDFFLGIYDTALEEHELVHSISVPCAQPEQRFGFYELARRHGDYAMAGVAISARSVAPYADLRIVFFSVSDHAVRASAVEAALQGRSCDDEAAFKQACDALAELEFHDDLHASANTKAHLAKVVLKRALDNMMQEQR